MAKAATTLLALLGWAMAGPVTGTGLCAEGAAGRERYNPTEAEEQRDRQLQGDYQQQIAVVGRMIDGKE